MYVLVQYYVDHLPPSYLYYEIPMQIQWSMVLQEV